MTLSIQFQTMIVMIMMGIVIGMSFETYSRLIPAKKTWYLVRFINDSLFWVIQGLLVFWALLIVNQGEIRFYIFLALLCGYAAYKGLLESSYRRVLEFIIKTTIRIYYILKTVVFNVLVKPIRGFLKLLISLVKMLFGIILSVAIYIGRILFLPIKWVFLWLWGLVPDTIIIKFSKLAGFLKEMKNTLTKWFRN